MPVSLIITVCGSSSFALTTRCVQLVSYSRSKLESCIVLNEHNTVFARSSPLYATGVFLPGPTRVFDANGISIASAVSTRPTRWQTDWQTDRLCYSVGSNRRSTQWWSQILLLSISTTSIYCSCQLTYTMLAFPSPILNLISANHLQISAKQFQISAITLRCLNIACNCRYLQLYYRYL